MAAGAADSARASRSTADNAPLGGDSEAYLRAIEDAREERDHLHPHAPQLGRADGVGSTGDITDRYLDPVTIERGRAWIDRLREQIDTQRTQSQWRPS
jgi:hypothetical protein